MCSPADPAVWANTFALVAYIPDELGLFLNTLRCELVPRCTFASHVTVLPPRPLQGSVECAVRQIRTRLRDARPFTISMESVQIFPRTSVLYLEIGEGREELIRLHEELNQGVLGFDEPYPFHPHVTLAQDFPVERLEELHRLAQHRWRQFAGRSFLLDSFTFVRRRVDNNWSNLAECALEQVPVGR